MRTLVVRGDACGLAELIARPFYLAYVVAADVRALEVLYFVGEHRILAFDVGDGDAVIAETGVAGAVAGIVMLAFRCSSLCSPVWLGLHWSNGAVSGVSCSLGVEWRSLLPAPGVCP